MPDPSRDDAQDARLARLEAAVGITPPTPVEPQPAAGKPAKPTGLKCVIGPDGRPTLTWDSAPGVESWDVRDELNGAKPVQETVTQPRSARSAIKAGAPARRYSVVARNSAGVSVPSDPIDVKAPDASAPAPTSGGVVPASAVDLSRWKLTIPEQVAGKVVEIRPPALATYGSRYFERQPDGSLLFRTWHGGATTSGSLNPRSELRERVGDDPEGYWQAGKGRHTMEWTGQVNRLTKVKPHVVIGQVHDDKDDVVVWRVEGDKLWLTKGDDPHAFLVDGAFALGKPYTCRYEITNGDYAFFYNGRRLGYTLRSTAPSYFKAGLYLQSNSKTAPTESPNEFAEVVLRSVTVTHA